MKTIPMSQLISASAQAVLERALCRNQDNHLDIIEEHHDDYEEVADRRPSKDKIRINGLPIDAFLSIVPEGFFSEDNGFTPLFADSADEPQEMPVAQAPEFDQVELQVPVVIASHLAVKETGIEMRAAIRTYSPHGRVQRGSIARRIRRQKRSFFN